MLQDKMKNKVIKLVFWLILLMFDLCFSQIQQDPRIGLLPYHEQLKALQRYEEIRQFQDSLMTFQEKTQRYDLSKDLAQNNPRQYEQNWRSLADLYGEFTQTIKLPSSFTPQMRDTLYQDFAEKRKSLLNAADDFRRNVVEGIERAKGKIVENFVKNTIITAAAVAATVMTAGASSPLLVGTVASWGTDLALSGYQYYNLENRDVYDAINWSRSEEYKTAQVTASAAKVAIGFGTKQLGYDNALQGAQTTLQIASIGQPYYNTDTNKALTTTQTGLSIYSSSVDLARDRNATNVVAQDKQVVEKINPQYAANYTAAQRWELVSNISRDISATTQIVSSLSTLYAVYNPQNSAAAKLSSDLNFYSSILSYGSQISGGMATRLTTQANERVINDYAFTRVNYTDNARLSGLKISEENMPFVGKLYKDKVQEASQQFNNLSNAKYYVSTILLYGIASQSVNNRVKENYFWQQNTNQSLIFTPRRSINYENYKKNYLSDFIE